MRFASVVCVVVMTSPAVAGPAAGQQDVIPSGKEWFCFVGESVSQCRRLNAECEDIRRRYEARDPSKTFGSCKQQKKAAVVTFLDVLKDTQRFIAAPTFEACNTIRASFKAKGDDYSRISSCQAVGERRSKLQAKVPKGAFYCNATVFGRKTIGGLYGDTCHRSLDACQKDLDEQRSQAHESDPVEVVMDCERRDMAYAIKATKGPGVVLHPDWCEGCDLVW